jgi:hypothetical protein
MSVNEAVPFLDLATLHRPIRPQLDAAYKRVMDSGWFIAGPELEAFESELKVSAPEMLKSIQNAPLSPDVALAERH